MFKKSIVVFGLVFSSFSRAAVSDTPAPQGQPAIFYAGGAEDLLNVTKNPETTAKRESSLSITLSCTDDHGKEYKRGDTGYSQCIENSKNNKPSTGSPSNLKVGTGVNF